MNCYSSLLDLLSANPNLKEFLGNNAVIGFYENGKIVVVSDRRGQTYINVPDCYLKAITTGGPGPQGYFVGEVNETAQKFMASIPKNGECKTWRFGAAQGAIVDLNGNASKVPSIGIEGAFDDDMCPIAIEVTVKLDGTAVVEISDAFEPMATAEQPAIAMTQPAAIG